MYDYMNEVLLLVAMVILLLLPNLLLKRVQQPTQLYIRIIAAIILIILVWLFADNDRLGIKLFLTIVVAGSVYKSWKENRKPASQ